MIVRLNKFKIRQLKWKIYTTDLSGTISPDICISNNQKSKFRELDDLKYVSALNEELKEETKEYLADNSIDELAYIIGVIEALAITKGSNLDEV